MTRQRIYCSTYCNFGHDTRDGKPIAHECRVIPPAALAAEMAGDFETAIRLMAGEPAVMHPGKRRR